MDYKPLLYLILTASSTATRPAGKVQQRFPEPAGTPELGKQLQNSANSGIG